MRRGARLGLAVALAALAAACDTGLGLGRGRLYACERDAGWLGDGGGEPGCPGGFHCGLEGYCHARDSGVAWRCEADFDCDPLWRCGLRGDGGVGACQSRAVGGPYPCVPGDDSACEQGWRCGLSGLCHNPDAGSALPCREGEDGWCDQGWRCGPELVCVDPSREALQPTPERDGGAERLSPRLTQGATGVSAQQGPGALTVGWARGQEVLVASWAAAGPTWTPPAVLSLDAGPAGPDAGVLVQAFGNALYFTTGPGVRRVPFGVDAGAAVPLPVEPGGAFPFVPTGLRGFEPGGGPRLLIGFNAQSLAVLPDDGGAAPLPLPFGGVRDVQPIEGGEPALLGATAGGLQWTPLRTPAWSPVLAGGPTPPPAVPDALVALRYQPRTVGGLVTFIASDGGTPQVGALALGPVTLGSLLAAGPRTVCEACPGGGQVVSLLPAAGAPGAERVRVRCSRGAQTYVIEYQVMGLGLQCGGAMQPAPPAVDDPGGPARVEVTGVTALTAGTADDFVTLGTTPWAFVETDAGTACFAQQHETGGLFLLDQRLGFAALRFAPPAAISSAAPVEGTPDLAVVLTPTDLRVVSASAQRASATISADLLGGPLHATARRDDGGTSLYVTDFDTLYSGQLDDGASSGTLQARAVPLPRQAIQSVAAQSPAWHGDGGVTQHLGYLVVQGRVFRFLSYSEQVWRTDELLMSGEAVAVWADGDRARVGLRDGTVLSLPSRVVVGAALPGGEEVQQYAHVCGETFALGTAGLHRLRLLADGGVVGAWVDETRLDAVLVPRPMSSAGVALHTTPTDLLVSTPEHVVARLRLDCR